jgi:hypothetical protein
MNYILQVLEQELERREHRAKENFKIMLDLERENNKLKEQVDILKKDLRELSDYAKQNNIV